MRILLFVFFVFLLLSCRSLPKETTIVEPKPIILNEPLVKKECTTFPYDESDTPCNLLGWQLFAYQSLMHTKKEHQAALILSVNNNYSSNKKLILRISAHEKIEVRTQATSAMLALSKRHLNNFGHFFHMLAIYSEHELRNVKKVKGLKVELTKIKNKNIKLKKELDTAQSKIQAIMDIEKNIKAN